MTTSPTTMAVATPTAVTFPVRSRSSRDQTSMQPPGARNVLMNASAAYWLAATALPALNPNQPNQSSAAPSST